MHDKNPTYNADSIKVLKGLDAVRKRPGMYIGNTDDISGLHHMLYEVVDNSIDEALAGYCKNIIITLHEDNSASVLDDGRGIPTGIHKEEGISAAEVIMTQLHAGGKFSQEIYEVSGGLHGVGVSVVNALSSKLVLKIYQDKGEHEMEFERGVTTKPITRIGNTSRRGTFIRFWPDHSIFTQLVFDFKLLMTRFEELCFLNPGITIIIKDERTKQEKKFHDTGGIVSFAKHICGNREILNKNPLLVSEKYNKVQVDCAIYWTSSYTENLLCFTNTIPQSDGGTHLAGLKAGLTKSFQNFVKERGTKVQQKAEFVGEDIREGMCCVLSIKLPDPKFSSQTKEKLVSSEARQAVEHLIAKYAESWLEENPSDSSKIIQKVIASASAREAARRARDLSRKGRTSETTFQIAKKLAACSETDPTKCQLFIVEGDSAGGSVKQARNRFIQAVLPLRGKILNIEKVNLSKALSSEMITTLIGAIGTSIGEDFNLEKLRYHKIIIMTDADVDGKHIESLLLTFFFRYMRPLLENGHIYLAAPPLYGIVFKKGVQYLRDDRAFREYIFDRGVTNTVAVDIHGNPIMNLHGFLHRTSQVRRNLPNPFWQQVIASKTIAREIEDGVSVNKVDVEKLISFLAKREKETWKAEDDHITATHNGIVTKYDLDEIDDDLVDYLDEFGHLWGDNAIVDDRNADDPFKVLEYVEAKGTKGLQIQRYKGLGEMPMPPLIDAMNAYTNLTLDDAILADQLCVDLMGENTQARRKFIEKYAYQAEVDL